MAKINGIETTGISKVGPVTFSSAAKFNGIELEEPGPGFVTEWTVAGDATARMITLPLYNSGTFNCTVKWGDGTADSTITSYNDANRIHTYASDGTYEVEILGECPSWSFNNAGDKLKITDIINWGDSSVFGGFAYLTSGFYGCTNLKSLGPTGSKIISKSGLTSLFQCFRECNHSSLTSIPAGLFDNCVYLTTFDSTFFNCTSLTSIPSGLFDYNTSVSSTGFSSTFRVCTSLTSIPSGLFDYNTSVSSAGFLHTFRDCTSLTSIPSGLFDYNTSVSSAGFSSTFYSCTSLATVPANLFRNNISVSTNGFYQTFYNCPKLKQDANIFYASGEESTRFKDRISNFYQCFYRTSFTGSRGTAPGLWNCDFGTQTPTTTGCWGGSGNSNTSLTNYGSIPSGWK